MSKFQKCLRRVFIVSAMHTNDNNRTHATGTQLRVNFLQQYEEILKYTLAISLVDIKMQYRFLCTNRNALLNILRIYK